MKSITQEHIQLLNQKYQKKPVQKALQKVLLNNPLGDIAGVLEQKNETKFRFSHEIKTLPVANQQQSGRCWIFAGLNVLREMLAQKYELKDFEFSQNYIAFWDKFEKINYFIQSIDDFLDVDSDDRTLKHLLHTGIQDGGQWDMFVSLVLKYGLVPKDQMEETKQSSGTMFMNRLINIKLRRYASLARKIEAKNRKTQLSELKEKTTEELYTFLVTCFGMPPQTFDFEYQNQTGDVHVIKNLTPQAFYQDHVGDTLEDYVSIIHAPTKDKPYNQTYTVAYLGNVIGGHPIKYLNLEISALKDLVIKQIMNKEVVWFGADVSRFGDRAIGYWDDQSFDFDGVLEMDFDMSKEDQLDYGQSAMNHAMVITGVHMVDNQPKRYKIENSWGSTNGDKGYYLMTDTWFDQFVYQAVIHKKYLSSQELAAWESEPKVLKPWDPMGSLAK